MYALILTERKSVSFSMNNEEMSTRIKTPNKSMCTMTTKTVEKKDSNDEENHSGKARK